ncbi:DUF6296 family protein [Kitasatospora sp. NPDC018058]|uniref:DUF6296 family protein n=1 Tax=Kitasatospora sp. NPDC018058 TaxID=3364025 RepID=UPI0037C0A077
MRILERRYAVTLPGPIGGHAPPAVVVVHATDAVGPGGTLVWESVEGDLRVEITGEVATVLAAPAGTPNHPCLHAVALPAGPLDFECTQAPSASRAMNP